MKDFIDVTSFFDEFKKAANEVKVAGGKISGARKIVIYVESATTNT